VFAGSEDHSLRQALGSIEAQTAGKGLVEVTKQVVTWTRAQGMASGLLTLFCRHTTASLLIQENAAAEVRADLADFFEQIAPEGAGYRHDDEGPDDMPSHIRAALTAVQLSIPVVDGRPVLGTWQGIYLFEHRRRPHRREIALHLIGE
jgi:secondary thiamine-phosphate synthase enzyme